jgi:hypothetical protein
VLTFMIEERADRQPSEFSASVPPRLPGPSMSLLMSERMALEALDFS